MWRTILLYALALALAAAALEWLEYRYLVRSFSTEIYMLLLAAGFVALGIWAGMKLTPRALHFLEIGPVCILVALVSAVLLRNPKVLPATVR